LAMNSSPARSSRIRLVRRSSRQMRSKRELVNVVLMPPHGADQTPARFNAGRNIGHTRVMAALDEIERNCQSACKFDPSSASNFDPFVRRGLTVALGSLELAGIAETRRARVA